MEPPSSGKFKFINISELGELRVNYFGTTPRLVPSWHIMPLLGSEGGLSSMISRLALGTGIAQTKGTMWNRFKSIQFRGWARVAVLLGLVVVEGVFAWHLWDSAKDSPTAGYLLKVGQRYLVIWSGEERGYDSLVYQNLGDALDFAQTELNMDVGQHAYGLPELEWLSLQDRAGTFLLQWKTFEVKVLHQMTFHDRREATRFAQAIRKGAYSPSPFGHSLVLRPKTASNR